MTYDFDEIISRYGTNCAKHDLFERDVAALWVADMDFPAPDEIANALRERLAHPIFGYTLDSPELRTVICERLDRLYDWQVTPNELVFLPGVVAGFNAAVRANAQPDGKVLVQTPLYPPMLSATGGVGQQIIHAPLARVEDGPRLHYEIDFDVFEDAIDANTHTFLMCNPHNPVGRVFTREELTRLAEICEKHDLMIISDDIHCDLVFEGHPHTPIAAISPEISKRTITLMAPSKTYNIPSLGFSFAVIQDEALRHRFQAAEQGVVPHVGVLGFTAALAAYQHGDAWLAEVLAYLQGNRDFVTQYVAEFLPGVRVTHPEGTYLSWLDLRSYHDPEARIGPGDGLLDTIPEEFMDFLSQGIEPFLLKNARVALNNGSSFGPDGVGFARLNFASPRSLLDDALFRIRQQISTVTS